MPDAIWPNGLRVAGELNVSGSPQSNLEIFTPKIGPVKTSRKSTHVVRMYSITLPLLSRDEYHIFKNFFHATLADGNLPFLWVDPMQGRFPYVYESYIFADGLPDLIADFQNDLYALDTLPSTEFYQRMKIIPISETEAYQETRITPVLFTVRFNVVLL